MIINADDFGLDKMTNRGILESFKKGLCSSATMMANMPGFQEACQLTHEYNLLNHVGIHLVLRDGYPLTEKIKHLSKFCNAQGQLCFSPEAFFIGLGNPEKMVLAEEIRAQIKRCREHGLPLTHLDTHHNLHTVWSVASVLIAIARQENIRYIRIKSNTDLYSIPFRFRIYTQVFNYRLKAMRLAKTRYFGSVQHYLALKERLPLNKAIDSFEICVHPKSNDKGEPMDISFGKEGELETRIKQIDNYREGVSFSGAMYL